MKKLETPCVVTCKLASNLVEHVDEVGRKLDLGRSEILRRAISIGLKAFDTAKLPGSRSTEPQPEQC